MSQYPASIKYTADNGWIIPPAQKSEDVPKKPRRKPKAVNKPEGPKE